MFSKTGHLALGPIKDLLLDMAEAHEAETIPSLVLRRLVDSSESLVLAGVWLLGPAGGTEWLELAATAGTAPLDPADEGAMRRVPATAFDIGRLTGAADPIVVPRSSFDMPAAILNWADGRDIAGFWGQRVAWRGTTFGVIGAFSTTTPTRSDDDVLRLVASQLGAAIARERASHELHELRERLAADSNGAAAVRRRQGRSVRGRREAVRTREHRRGARGDARTHLRARRRRGAFGPQADDARLAPEEARDLRATLTPPGALCRGTRCASPGRRAGRSVRRDGSSHTQRERRDRPARRRRNAPLRSGAGDERRGRTRHRGP